MFYSHQLLARKAPLGQIWMAATLNSKINRKKLDKLDIIQICEEILNPTVPMSLRLTGILMGGVVIVYQRKVELLYDDLSRLVSELNEAGKIRSNQFTDRTILPKGKAQAKYEAVTLPVPEHMQLADMEEEFVNMDIGDDNQHHQEDTVNITILDHVTFSGGNRYDRFERFDMGEEEIHFNETNTERNRPSPIVQSPPQYEDAAPFDTTFAMPSSPCHPQDPPQGGLSEKQDEQGIEINDEEKQQQPQKPKARKRKRAENNNGRNKVVFDNDQTIVANPVYQSWLKDTSNILRERRKVNQDPINAMKLTNLLELPPVGIITAFEDFPPKFYYPEPVMDLWKECIKFSYSSNKEKSPTGIRSPNVQREENIPDNGFYYPRDIPEFPQEIYENDSAEHLRFAGSSEIPGNLSNGSVNTSGSEVLKGVRGSAEIFSGPEIFPIGRSKKRQSFSNAQLLEPVLEEPNYGSFKIKDLSENGTIPEELIEETGPTQTPIRRTYTDTPVDAVTQSIRMQFKTHFETPGAPQKESLDQLTHGMDPKQAARLFYQTCVLATCNYVKVEQPEPYEEIFISKGPKM